MALGFVDQKELPDNYKSKLEFTLRYSLLILTAAFTKFSSIII